MTDEQPALTTAGGWCAPSETLYELHAGIFIPPERTTDQ